VCVVGTAVFSLSGPVSAWLAPPFCIWDRVSHGPASLASSFCTSQSNQLSSLLFFVRILSHCSTTAFWVFFSFVVFPTPPPVGRQCIRFSRCLDFSLPFSPLTNNTLSLMSFLVPRFDEFLPSLRGHQLIFFLPAEACVVCVPLTAFFIHLPCR